MHSFHIDTTTAFTPESSERSMLVAWGNFWRGCSWCLVCAATSGSGVACAIPMEKDPQGEDYDNTGQIGWLLTFLNIKVISRNLKLHYRPFRI